MNKQSSSTTIDVRLPEMFFTLVRKKKIIKSEKVLENVKTPNVKSFNTGHKGLLWERVLRAQLYKLQCMSSDGWQTFCAEGSQRCLSMQVWTYVHAEGASRETLMSVFLVVFSHTEIKTKKDSKHPFGLCKIQRWKDASRFFFQVSYKSRIYLLPWQHHRVGDSSPHGSLSCCLLGSRGERRARLLWSTCGSCQSKKRGKITIFMVQLECACSSQPPFLGWLWPWRSCWVLSCCGQRWNQVSVHFFLIYSPTAPERSQPYRRETEVVTAFTQPCSLPVSLKSCGMGSRCIFYLQLYIM